MRRQQKKKKINATVYETLQSGGIPVTWPTKKI